MAKNSPLRTLVEIIYFVIYRSLFFFLYLDYVHFLSLNKEGCDDILLLFAANQHVVCARV